MLGVQFVTFWFISYVSPCHFTGRSLSKLSKSPNHLKENSNSKSKIYFVTCLREQPSSKLSKFKDKSKSERTQVLSGPTKKLAVFMSLCAKLKYMEISLIAILPDYTNKNGYAPKWHEATISAIQLD